MIVSTNPQVDLGNMMSGVVKYQPIFNILMNDLPRVWYDKLGQYIKNNYLNLQADYGIRPSCDDSSLSICFISGSMLSLVSLGIMFGEPLLHSSFGEGPSEVDPEFSTEYDYASYFVTISDCLFHIGYDHRGTKIECPVNTKPELIYESLCEIVNRFIEIKKE